MAATRLKILLASAEVAPFAKVGGLADVAGALPKALAALKHDARVVMPAYRMVLDRWPVEDVVEPFELRIRPGVTACAWVKQTRIAPDIPVYLVGGHPHFDQATESRKIYSLDPDPYIFFNRAAAEMVPLLQPAWAPDVLHANDWHTGLLPVYLDLHHRGTPAWSRTARVFTIHNLAHQGEFDFPVLNQAGLPPELFTFDRVECYGRFNFMKCGLVYSHRVNTVSKTYAREIQTPEYGCRLDGLLRWLAEQGRLSGIVNGIDYSEYNPATDPRIPAHFSADSPEGKALCRAALQKERNLPARRNAAVVGIISRLADQKGFDLIADAAQELLSLPVQLVVLGTGEPRYEALFRDLAARHPKQVSAEIGFDADLAQRIYAGSDMFLMPSRFEPCGLGQLMSLRYGTIPIVRATGGLADTIVDYRPGKGTGFVFRDYCTGAMMGAVRRAVGVFADRQEWAGLVQRALRADFSWTSSARRYAALYREAVAAARGA